MPITNIIKIFNQSIEDYHITDNINTPLKNPYQEGTFDALFYNKNWIDTVQWHFEDIIRDPNINPVEALKLKRSIDKYNQMRTDIVEKIDDIYFEKYKDVVLNEKIKINTETMGWAIDRMSILCLKIYHMRSETLRIDIGDEHKKKCDFKLDILLNQQSDLAHSISQLEADIQNGKVKILLYKQMKMYNDANLNPILYSKKK